VKIFFGIGFALILAASAPAQFGGSGALGGPFISRGVARPLGGIGPSNPNSPRQGDRGARSPYARNGALGVYAFPFAYSTYVPNYFSTPDYDYWAPPPVSQAPLPGYAAPAPPVIINQYFGAPPDNSGPPPPSASNGPITYQAPSAPVPGSSAAAGDPIGPAQNYYLIAYKDHSVYSVLAYWLEGDTLHYVTTQNTHNQASMNLIDLDLTKTLNQARGVPFTIAGR
jgi:hypothetical protein